MSYSIRLLVLVSAAVVGTSMAGCAADTGDGDDGASADSEADSLTAGDPFNAKSCVGANLTTDDLPAHFARGATHSVLGSVKMVARWRQWRQSCTTETGASCAAWTVFSGAPNDSLPYIIDMRANDVSYAPPEYAYVPFALPANPASSFLGLSYDTARRPHLDVDVANAQSEMHLDLLLVSDRRPEGHLVPGLSFAGPPWATLWCGEKNPKPDQTCNRVQGMLAPPFPHEWVSLGGSRYALEGSDNPGWTWSGLVTDHCARLVGNTLVVTSRDAKHAVSGGLEYEAIILGKFTKTAGHKAAK